MKNFVDWLTDFNAKFCCDLQNGCEMNAARTMSSISTQQPGSLPDFQVDPYRLLEADLKDLYEDIRQVNPHTKIHFQNRCREWRMTKNQNTIFFSFIKFKS